ncbi:MAG: MFS transporter, partial [Dehalococcoidia bacterium]
VAQVSVFSNLAEGFRYIGRERSILVLLIISLVPSLFMMPFTHGILPVLAEEVLHAGPEGLGYLFSAAGFGGFVATFVVASQGNFRRKGLLMLGGITTAGFAMILLSRMTSMPLAMVSMALVAGNDMIFRAVNNTLLQTRTEDQYRSRVMSVLMMDHGLVPLGSLLAGTLAQFYGAPLAILVGGTTVIVLTGLLAARFSNLRTG